MAGRSAEQAIPVPLLKCAWLTITFVHWRVPAGEIQALLPDGLTVDQYDDTAWVGLTPFTLADLRPLGMGMPAALTGAPGLGVLGRLSPLSASPETNLRTYVRGPDGRDGLWFLNLDIGNPALAAALRTAVGAPYNHGRLSLRQEGDRVSYAGSRTGTNESYRLEVRTGPQITAGDRDVWLTSRWRAYTKHLGRLVSTPVQHEPWPLHQAHAEVLEQNLTDALGIGLLAEPPVVHFSPGVRQVRVGVPRLL